MATISPSEAPPAVPTRDEEHLLASLKDLAEHIRTVHFSLLVLCLILFAITWRPRPNAERAVSDANALSKLASETANFNAILTRIDQESTEALKNQFGRTECLPTVQVTWPDRVERYRLKVSRCWIYKNQASWKWRPGELVLPYQLEDFSSFWTYNRNPTIYIPGRLEGEFKFVNKDDKTLPVELLAASIPQPQSGSTGKITEIPVEPIPTPNGRLQFTNHAGLGSSMPLVNDQPLNVDIILDKAPVSLNLQDVISQTMNKKWSKGDFEDSFPDLAKMSKAFMDVSLPDLPIKLNLYKKSYGKWDIEEQEIDVWGVKLSIATLRTIGILLLAGCQFYLWLHLEELSELMGRLAARTSSVGWIGLYRALPAQAFIIVSILLLPTCIVGFVIIAGWAENLRSVRFLQALFAGCSLALSVMLAMSLYRLWTKPATTAEPATSPSID